MDDPAEVLDDAELVRRTAAEFIALYGPRALEHLLQWEQLTREMGDRLSANAWLDIAQSAAEQMRAERRAPSVRAPR